MTSKTRKEIDSTLLALFIAATWVVGVLIHLGFQRILGSWYDGLVFNMGYQSACLIFLVTFSLSTTMALSGEKHFGVRSSLGRCFVHLGTGIVVVPMVILSLLLSFGPELNQADVWTILGLELLFAMVTWAVTLLGAAFVFETVILRR